MANPRFIIRVQFSNLRAEVWVNGIPVGMVLPRDASPMAIPVNQFLTYGRNTVGVVLHAGPVPSRAGEPWLADAGEAAYSGPATLSLRIAQYAPEQTALGDNPPPIATIEWQGLAAPQPSYVGREFTLGARLGPWVWETAARFLVLDTALRSHALDYIAYLHGLLAAKRFDSFLAESAMKLNELTSGAYGIPPEPLRRDMLQALQSRSTPPYELDPLNAHLIDLRLVADGRMIECLRPDRRYVLSYRPAPGEDDVFFLPTMIGQTGGQWGILR